MGMFDSFMGSSTKAASPTAEPVKAEPAVAEPPKTPLDQFGDL